MVAVVTPTNLGAEFDIGVLVPTKISVRFATSALRGIVALATAADYPDPLNDTDAVTPAYLQAAVAAISGHVPATMATGGLAAAALGIVAAGVDNQTFTLFPAIATGNAYGVVQLAVAADYPQPLNDVDAVTPAYLQAAISAIPGGHVPATMFTGGPAAAALGIVAGGVDNQTFTLFPAIAGTASYGVVQLATAADYPDPLNDTDAVTPAYLNLAIPPLVNATLPQMVAGAPDAGTYASPQDVSDVHRSGQNVALFTRRDMNGGAPVTPGPAQAIKLGSQNIGAGGTANFLSYEFGNVVGTLNVFYVAAGLDLPTETDQAINVGGDLTVLRSYVSSLMNVTGTAIGVSGQISPLSANISIGVFGQAAGGVTNYAGYFGGDIFYTGALIPSDENVKTDLAPVNDAAVVAGLMGMSINTYRPMVNPNAPGVGPYHKDYREPYLGPVEIGPTAQEIAAGFPDAVQDVNGVLCVRDRSITYATLRLVQMQQDAIVALTARVAALEAQ